MAFETKCLNISIKPTAPIIKCSKKQNASRTKCLKKWMPKEQNASKSGCLKNKMPHKQNAAKQNTT
jgi:hypothetical protein